MIEVRYSDCALVLKGHAEAGPYGADLICCGASMLLGTLIEALQRQNTPGLWFDLGPGRGEVRCQPEKQAEETFRVILAGLELLEKTYPQFVRITPCAGNGAEVSA